GVHCDRAEYEQADPLFQRAVRIMENLDGDEDICRLRVQSLNGLATLRRLQGHYAEAEPLLRRALKLAEKAFPASDMEIADTLNNLGVLYKYQNRFAEAERHYRRA